MLQNHQSHVHVGAAEAPSTLIHSFLTLSQRSESIRVALPGVQKVASVGIGGTNPIPRSELAKPVKGGNTATNKPHSRCVCVCVCVLPPPLVRAAFGLVGTLQVWPLCLPVTAWDHGAQATPQMATIGSLTLTQGPNEGHLVLALVAWEDTKGAEAANERRGTTTQLPHAKITLPHRLWTYNVNNFDLKG
mmetsp:Transcript_36613/g.59886  ORF Transcript_36613/g.59886 Transcript_36613/m.59886 type:complete len:190 (+) Transcript_36613:205-774(+)